MEKSQNNYSQKKKYGKRKRYKRRYRNYRRVGRYNNGNNWNFNIEILSLDDIKTRQLLDDKAYQDYLRDMNSKGGADND